ncbi:MAG: hypothetical protein FRX49_04084 [Trebouxia sp. A1-2]|nr:MAG: hypothetical protein FRX49_04084 [Trebouxia sp. A1-2]
MISKRAWKAMTNLKQVGKVVHIYEVCVLGESIKGGHQQREPLLSADWAGCNPCLRRVLGRVGFAANGLQQKLQGSGKAAVTWKHPPGKT